MPRRRHRDRAQGVEKPFNTPLEMHTDYDTGESGWRGEVAFNTPLEMLSKTFGPHFTVRSSSFNTPLEMPSGFALVCMPDRGLSFNTPLEMLAEVHRL